MSIRTAAEIREGFLRFFESKGHTRVSSSPLVPQNDPTLLFTNAGMNQFKDVFTGREKRDYSRAASSQKCVRAGGKHNDLDNVGHTARHHTFFEMLGNFSFGDYFKKDAVAYAWEFITSPQWLGLPVDKLAVTIFQGEGNVPADTEAEEFWKAQGVRPERIFRLGKKDNFWAMGDTGPCGPCSEIHIFRGTETDRSFIDSHAKKFFVDNAIADSDSWMELWNLVFMQFEVKEKDGPLLPLPKPSIDTGAGLERLASVVQGVATNYDTDLLKAICSYAGELGGKKYGSGGPTDIAMRVIADHSRAAAFLIADGVLPSNEGRGSTLRSIMRRAIRYGSQHLGLTELFLFKTADKVIELMGAAYPELRDQRSLVIEACKNEETSFRKTLEKGLKMLHEEMAHLSKDARKTILGETVFYLYDTHGFPPDVTGQVARENGFEIDLDGFKAKQAEAKGSSEFKGQGEKISDVYFKVQQRVGDSAFKGYEGASAKGKLVALIRDGSEVQSAKAGETVELVFDATPFYGESGGQVGDTGRVHGGEAEAIIEDAQKPVHGLVVHSAKVKSGNFEVGKSYELEVDDARRTQIRANHSATHLLHRALKEILGEHVKQAGSVVAPDLLRFDFSHFAPVTPEELTKIERRVNRMIRENKDATTKELPIEEAKKTGAVSMFGEKYGARVRVVSVHPDSIEFCGGTHVHRSGDIGFFKNHQRGRRGRGRAPHHRPHRRGRRGVRRGDRGQRPRGRGAPQGQPARARGQGRGDHQAHEGARQGDRRAQQEARGRQERRPDGQDPRGEGREGAQHARGQRRRQGAPRSRRQAARQDPERHRGARRRKGGQGAPPRGRDAGPREEGLPRRQHGEGARQGRGRLRRRQARHGPGRRHGSEQARGRAEPRLRPRDRLTHGRAVRPRALRGAAPAPARAAPVCANDGARRPGEFETFW